MLLYRLVLDFFFGVFLDYLFAHIYALLSKMSLRMPKRIPRVATPRPRRRSPPSNPLLALQLAQLTVRANLAAIVNLAVAVAAIVKVAVTVAAIVTARLMETLLLIKPLLLA